MAKEAWKIQKFEGGLNDYTDPKDISDSEFVEAQDVYVGKVGQIKGLGEPVSDSAIESINVIAGVDTTGDGSIDKHGGMLPGKGFFKSPNDHTFDPLSTETSSQINIEHTTAAHNGTLAECEFVVESCLMLFSYYQPLTADFNWSMRIQAKEKGGSTLIPSGTAGFDVAGTWDIISNYGQGDLASELDNSSVTINNNTFTLDPLAQKVWSIDVITAQHIGLTNLQVLGGVNNRAIGFYRYRGHQLYDDPSFGFHDIRLPIVEAYFGGQEYWHMSYELMRDSFCTKLVALINARTSTPNVTATYGGFGTGAISIKATNVGTTLNAYEITPTMALGGEGTGVNASSADILVSDIAVNNTKSNGGHLHISGQTAFAGGTAAVADVWKIKIEGTVANNDLITVSIWMNDGGAPQGQVQNYPFLFYSTHVVLANEIQTVCNAIIGITASVDTSNANYTYVVLTASGTGLSNGFHVETQVETQDGFFASVGISEQHALITLDDTDYDDVGIVHGEDIFGDAITGNFGEYPSLGSGIEYGTSMNIYGTRFQIYSSSNNSWNTYNGQSIFHPSSDVGGRSNIFDWVWAAEHDEYPEPVFFGDGNTLVACDGNFNLPNHTFFFGYKDRSYFFRYLNQDVHGNNNWVRHYGFSKLKKWVKWPDRKTWSFTEEYYYGAKNPSVCWEGGVFGYGVRVCAGGVAGPESGEGVLDEDYTRPQSQPGWWRSFFQLNINKSSNTGMGEAGYLDWGGVEPDEDNPDNDVYTVSETKWYCAAVYDDGSETLPVHQFKFRNNQNNEIDDMDDNMKFEWNQYPKISFIFRPMSGACQDHLISGATINNADLENQICFPDPRVKGLRIYYTDDQEAHQIYWNVMLIDFEKGIQVEGSASFQRWVNPLEHGQDPLGDWHWQGCMLAPIGWTGMTLYKKPKGATYEFFNGFNPVDVQETVIRYKHAVLAGNRAFVGNIEVESNIIKGTRGIKRVYNDTMVMSNAGKVTTFPYPDNVFVLNASDGDEITGLATVGQKILQFKRTVLYIVDISGGVPAEFSISDTLHHRGIMDGEHFCETTDGIFFFNEIGAWIYTGDELKNIMSSDAEDSQQRIDPATWKDFVSIECMCEFNPLSKEVIVIKKKNQTSTASDGDCYIYNLSVDAWSTGKERFHTGHSTGVRNLSNFAHVGADNKIGFMAQDSPDEQRCVLNTWEYFARSSNNFQLVTKSTNLGDPRSLKSILGFITSVTQASADSTYNLTVFWRESVVDDWMAFDNISNSDSNNTIEGLTHRHMFKPPIVKGIKSIQLKISGTINGDFAINDIALIFRKYRSDDLSTFKATTEE